MGKYFKSAGKRIFNPEVQKQSAIEDDGFLYSK